MKLQRLLPAARLRLQPDFYSGAATPEIEEFVKPWDRDLELDLLDALLSKVLEDDGPDLSPGTDSWLAPRLHAGLRLTRREASDRDIWSFLAVVGFPKYVRARWGAEPGRFFGAEVNQAFARLWWGAELFRNGSDYAPVATAFSIQDVPNTWFRLDACHSRALAVGLTQLIEREALTGRQVNALATATNLSLTTSVLDSISSSGSGPHEDPEWVSGRAEPDRLTADDLPMGPNDSSVAKEAIEKVVDFLSELLKSARVRT